MYLFSVYILLHFGGVCDIVVSGSIQIKQLRSLSTLVVDHSILFHSNPVGLIPPPFSSLLKQSVFYLGFPFSIWLNIPAALSFTMRRRGPPSSLRLVQGPLPARSQPRHALPSVPRPVFHPEAFLSRGPAPAPRTRQANPSHLIFPDLPLTLELAAICRPSSSGNSTPTSSPTWSPTKRVRGPWDDSSCFDFVVDVDSILALPKPVAMGV